MTAAAMRGPVCTMLTMVPGTRLVLEKIISSPALFFLPVPVLPAGWRQLVCLQRGGRVSRALFLPNMV